MNDVEQEHPFRPLPTMREMVMEPYHIEVAPTRLPWLRWRATVTGHGVGVYLNRPAKYGRTADEAWKRAEAWCASDRARQMRRVVAREHREAYNPPDGAT